MSLHGIVSLSLLPRENRLHDDGMLILNTADLLGRALEAEAAGHGMTDSKMRPEQFADGDMELIAGRDRNGVV